MSTTYAQTIDGNKIYAERSVQDKDGNQIDTTYAKISSLATVATSGDYDDLTNKPTIPSGADLVPSFTLPTDEGKVLTVGSSSTEWATPPSPSTKPVVAGNNIVITENTNNVSISTTGLQPSLPTISGHAGDVLTVNSQGNAIEWAPTQDTQVQADWAETSTSDPSYIQNKPTMNSLAAGSNISITPSGSTVTVAVTGLATVATSGSYADLSNTPAIPSGTQLVPAATSADADKVLTVDAQGTPEWASAQAPISAGTGIDITNNVVSVDTSVVATQTDLASKEDAFDVGTGLEMDTSGATPTLQVEAPVDIVAGPGIVIDNPDGNTLRVSQAYPTDETVLWEGTGWSVGDTGQSFTLSESPLNFKIIKVYGYRPLGAGSGVYAAVFSEEFDPNFLSTNSITRVMMPYAINNNGNKLIGGMGISGVTGTSWTEAGGFHMTDSSVTTGEFAHVHKVVGIHRTASN